MFRERHRSQSTHMRELQIQSRSVEIRSLGQNRKVSYAPVSSGISLTRLITSMVASPPLSSRPATDSTKHHTVYLLAHLQHSEEARSPARRERQPGTWGPRA